MFAYCNNNPIIYADTGGEIFGSLILGTAILCAAVASIAIVYSPPVQTAIRGLADVIGNAIGNLVTDTIDNITELVASVTEAKKKSKPGAVSSDKAIKGAVKGGLNQPDNNKNNLSLKKSVRIL